MWRYLPYTGYFSTGDRAVVGCHGCRCHGRSVGRWAVAAPDRSRKGYLYFVAEAITEVIRMLI